jgi:hypothetical protein
MTDSSNRILRILQFLATYYTLTRVQLQVLLALSGKNADRACRKLLLRLFQAGLINKTHGEVVFVERNGAPAPVYFPSRRGLEYLSAELQDERWMSCCCLTPAWQYLHHFTMLAQLHIHFDAAIAQQREVRLHRWLGEYDVANPNENDPAKRFKLFTEIQRTPKRLVANPDAAFLLSYREHRKVYFVELSRGTSGIRQIAASKTPGFAAMAQQRLHRRLYPDTTTDSFTVLAIEPSIGRRDLLAKAIRDKAGADLWKFAAWSEIKPETLLFEPIFRDCYGKASALVTRE